MTIEEIRNIPIAVFLARMGYGPGRSRTAHAGGSPQTLRG